MCPVRTVIPSASNLVRTASLTSKSSFSNNRFMPSNNVTFDPNRENACASSQPMGPPPTITNRLGNSRIFQSVSLVSGWTSSMPGIGGTNGRAPVAITIFFVVNVSPFISTRKGSMIFASPSYTFTPNSVYRFTESWGSIFLITF